MFYLDRAMIFPQYRVTPPRHTKEYPDTLLQFAEVHWIIEFSPILFKPLQLQCDSETDRPLLAGSTML